MHHRRSKCYRPGTFAGGIAVCARYGDNYVLESRLAVGVDFWLLATHSGAQRPAGFIVLSAATMREAFDHFRAGDFDLALLSHSLTTESKERLSKISPEICRMRCSTPYPCKGLRDTALRISMSSVPGSVSAAFPMLVRSLSLTRGKPTSDLSRAF